MAYHNPQKTYVYTIPQPGLLIYVFLATNNYGVLKKGFINDYGLFMTFNNQSLNNNYG